MALIKLNNQSLTNVTSAGLPSGTVLQVQSATKTDKQTTTSATPSDVTGLSVSITPTSTSSKIMIMTSINFGGLNNMYGKFDVLRDSTVVVQGTYPTGNQSTGTIAVGGDATHADYKVLTAAHNFLDSPATTSAVTYKVQFASTTSSRQFTINAPYATDNNDYIVGGTSSITVMEIAG